MQKPPQAALDRRAFLFGGTAALGALGLGGCVTQDGMSLAEAKKLYGPVEDKKFAIPAVDPSKVDPQYWRRTVRYESKEAPGTIIVDPGNYYVYRIEGDNTATRYGANVGRDGFRWNGDAYVGRKSEWATWTPPPEMIKRQPEAAKYARGMPGGLENPLGARTLHLYQNGRYTLYTIYASLDEESIGSGITSGCVRPADAGHDRPLRPDAGEDQGGRAAGLRAGEGIRNKASGTAVERSPPFRRAP